MNAPSLTRVLALAWRWGLLVAVASCSSDRGEPAVEFAITHTDEVESRAGSPVQLPPEPTTAQGGTGLIHVRGLIAFPDQCDDVRAQVEPGPTLRVTIQGSRTHDGGCGRADRVVMAQYEARLRDIRPGPYRLRIIYDYRGVRREERARAASTDAAAGLWRDREAGAHDIRVH